MSNDRDIEDILNSLNQLLREGESHNDDHSGSEDGHEKAASPEPEKAVDEAPVEAEAGTEPVKLQREKPVEDTNGDLQVSQSGDEIEQDEPRSPDDAPVSINRVVLTEDMMVNNPQGSLLSLVRNSAGLPKQHRATDENGKSGATSGSVRVDHDHMERLVRQISDDLIKRLEKELPGLIAESIRRHLKELKRDE